MSSAVRSSVWRAVPRAATAVGGLLRSGIGVGAEGLSGGRAITGVAGVAGRGWASAGPAAAPGTTIGRAGLRAPSQGPLAALNTVAAHVGAATSVSAEAITLSNVAIAKGLQAARRACVRPGIRGFAAEAGQSSASASTTSASAAAGSAAEAPGGAKKEVGKIRQMWQKYGWTFVGTYVAIWAGTLSSMYLIVSNNMMQVDNFDDDAVPNPFNPLEISRYVGLFFKKHLGIDLHLDKIDGKSSSFMIAYICTKVTEPLRFLLAAAITPRVARILRGMR